MNTRRAVKTLTLAWVAVLLCATAGFPQETVAVTGGTLIDGTGRAPVPDAIIVIRGREIAAVGPSSSVPVPAGSRRIDARGKYIVPGLMDANVHLVLDASIEFVARYEDRLEELIEEAAQVSLKYGLTTVFDSWGPLQPLMNVRDRIARGETEGARMFVAGNIIGFSGPFGRDFNAAAEATATKAFVERINEVWEENTGPELLWLTPEGVRQEVRKYIARGVDFIKYGASGHREENFLMFSPEAQRAMVEEAHRAGIISQTHTTSVESLRQAIEAGNDMLQHCSVTGPVPIPDAMIRLLKERGVYCAVQPRTLHRLDIEKELAEGRFDSEFRKARLQIWHENEVQLLRAGATLLLATDAGMIEPDRLAGMSEKELDQRPTTLGEAHFLWFEAMAEKGMEPMDAILAATRNIAAAYQKLDRIGTIESGKLADLVVLDADPLQDLTNLRRIHLVMKEGSVVDRDRLPIRRILSESLPTQAAGRRPMAPEAGAGQGRLARWSAARAARQVGVVAPFAVPSAAWRRVESLPRVLLRTELGDIVLEIDTARAPLTGANFLRYVDGRFYDGGLFFRTVTRANQPDDSVQIEVIQVGINPERSGGEYPPIPLETTRQTGLRHRDGTVSMARAEPNSARASFFICIGDQPSLDYGGRRNPDGQGFGAFGRVVEGMDVVHRIHGAPAEGQTLDPPVPILVARRL